MPEKPETHPVRSSTLYFLFFVSGLSALVYEVVWARLLGYVTGNSVYSVATVLATFMGGLALGSWLGGRRATLALRPIRGYARLEIGIGLAGLVVPFAIDGLAPVYRFFASITGAEPGSPGLLVMRFVMTAIILLVPTTLMGMTLPYLTRAVAHRLDRIGLSVGSLYGVNTFGAFAGALMAGFFFIPMFGMLGATIAAAVLNVLVAIAAFALDRRGSAAPAPAPGEVIPPLEAVATASPKKNRNSRARAEAEANAVAAAAAPEPAAPVSSAARTLLIVAFGIAGAASMIDQVAWTRVFSLIIGPTTYAFTLMVSAFILGLALGGFLGSLVIDRLRDRMSAFAGVQVLVGLSTLALVPILGQLPFRLVQPLYLRAAEMGFGTAQILVFVILFGLLVLPTTLMGFAFPLVARVVALDLQSAPRSVGVAYAGNTIGAILGSLAGGFLLVPLLGLQKSLYVAAMLNGVAAVVALVARSMLRPRGLRSFLPAAALPAFLIVLAIPAWSPNALSSGLYLYATERVARLGADVDLEKLISTREQLFYKEGVTTTVNVERDSNGNLYLRVTGKTDASTTDDMRTQLLLAHIPALLHPEPKDALVIGLGSGVTFGALLRYPTIASADCVEIAAEIVEAAELFGPWNDEYWRDPRQRVILEDARNFLLLTDKKYDLITSEPSNPWIAGIGTLFTREFFEIGRDHLRDDGLFCQWFSLLKMELNDFRSVIRTFTDVFPEATLFSLNAGVDYILVGGKGGSRVEFDWARVEKTFASSDVVRHREFLGIPEPEHILLTYIASDEALRRFGESGDVITDDHNGLEISMARNIYRRVPRFDITSAIADLAGDPASVVDMSGLSPEAKSELEAALPRIRECVGLLASTTRDNLDLVENPPDEDTLAERYLALKQDLETILEEMPGSFDAADSLSRFYKQEGMEYLQAERYEEAITAYRRAAEVKPGDAVVTASLAQLEAMAAQSDIAAGRIDAAVARLVAAQRLSPREASISILLADCYARQGKPRDRVRELERARSLEPKNPDVKCNLAEALFDLKTTTRAVELLEETTRENPNNAVVLHRIGTVYHRVSEMLLGDLVAGQRAIEYYVKSLQIKPDYLQPHHNLAVLYFETKYYAKARMIGEKLLQLAPDYPQKAQILYLLARSNAYLGDKAKALATLRELIAAGGRVSREDLETEPAFEALRADREFRGIVESLPPK